MTADVVEGADLLVSALHHDHRRLGGVDLLGEVATDPRDLLHPANVQPRTFEDRLTLKLIELR
jgi:hypothetical protein